MDRFEVRRLALKALVDNLGRGGRTEVAKRIRKEASYVSRLLYPPGKEGRKRIGDELMEAITAVYPDWMNAAPAAPRKRGATAPAANGDASHAAGEPKGDFLTFDLIQLPGGATLDRPQVAHRLELASAEVYRRLGYMPEPNRIRIFTQQGGGMRPTIDDGDIVLIDTHARQFAGDDSYLVSMAGDVQVKLLQRRGADVWVVSPNPDFPAWRVTEDTDMVICGRAVMRVCLRAI